MKTSVIIPVYKNLRMFSDNIRHNLKYLSGCEIIVVNDDPESRLEDIIPPASGIRLINNSQNLGFARSINAGVKITAEDVDILMLLNSDVRLNNNSWRIGLKHFDNKDVFAVSFIQRELDGRLVGKNRVFWREGLLQHEGVIDNKSGENGWAEAGSCLIDKQKFGSLGGFDPIFSPFYWEDVDLSLRAKKKGWKILFDSEIKVDHHHESTTSKYFLRQTLTSTAFRNQLICTWKNMDQKHIMEHFSGLPKQVIGGGWLFLRGFTSALLLYFRNCLR